MPRQCSQRPVTRLLSYFFLSICFKKPPVLDTINAETHEITIIESDTVVSYSTINLLSAIENKYPLASSIKVILDNAKYHYSEAVVE
ncbi:MAG: transposase [Coxiellaceae bacterium]|nr:transposase [Coxiellaceae bacterium]